MDKNEILNRIKVMYAAAKYEDAKLLSKGEYEWEIGTNILQKLVGDIVLHKDQFSTLMGIPVRINVQYPERIKLWREVTE